MLHSENALSAGVLSGLIDYSDEELHVCGGRVVRDDHPLAAKLATLKDLYYIAPINAAYYSPLKTIGKK